MGVYGLSPTGADTGANGCKLLSQPFPAATQRCANRGSKADKGLVNQASHLGKRLCNTASGSANAPQI